MRGLTRPNLTNLESGPYIIIWLVILMFEIPVRIHRSLPACQLGSN